MCGIVGILGSEPVAMQLVDVVQGRIADRHAADEHRLETPHGRQRSGSTHLEFDTLNLREFFLRGKLVGDGPARRPRHKPQFALHRQAINFVNDAIDVIAEGVALPAN